MAQLSVIIPVYNALSTLGRCVDSVMSQNVPDMEVILVDDGSTDGSSDICDALASAHDNIRVIHRTNGGLSAARNTGIRASRGEWISFIDSDDEFAPDTLAVNLEKAQSDDSISLVEFPVTVHYGSPRSFNLDFEPCTVSGDRVFGHWIHTEGYMHCYAWNKIYRSSLFSNISFPEGESFEDAAVCPLIMRQCSAVTYSNHGRYLYYSSKDSITVRYRFSNQEPLFRHNLELLHYITGQKFGLEDRIRLWNVTFNLLTDLWRCKDADAAYLIAAAGNLDSLKPGPSATRNSGITTRQRIKAFSAWILGVRPTCSLLAIKKYS